MNIVSFKNNDLNILKEKDENNRIIGYNIYNDIQIIGRNCFYPNVLIWDKENKIINKEKNICFNYIWIFYFNSFIIIHIIIIKCIFI